MEVHAHSHTDRKKWTHYFWEFLMLFLAVFCGFLAENIREHKVEHQREKQYMESLLSDLAADTAMIHFAIPRKEGRVKAIDSVFIFFKANPNTEKINGQLFKTIRRTNFDSRFIRNNITIDQLKNAGGMRLIRKKEVADSISSYDFRCESTEIYNELYIINSQLGNRQFEKLFNAADLLTLYIENNRAPIVANIPDSIVIAINTAVLNEQLNFMMLEKSYARQEIERYKELEGRAVRLMGLIKKEYHLSEGTPLEK
ncbi:MAG TPA: hypothetical protein VK483_02775 [Chitinophagaceae bacterium]|nr:hypothetical protein [Chitinophagaceae bacterium]